MSYVPGGMKEHHIQIYAGLQFTAGLAQIIAAANHHRLNDGFDRLMNIFIDQLFDLTALETADFQSRAETIDD
jgi:hypothetical protein